MPQTIDEPLPADELIPLLSGLPAFWRPALQSHLNCMRRLIRPAMPTHLLSRAWRAWNALTDVSRLQIHLTRAVDTRFICDPRATGRLE